MGFWRGFLHYCWWIIESCWWIIASNVSRWIPCFVLMACCSQILSIHRTTEPPNHRTTQQLPGLDINAFLELLSHFVIYESIVINQSILRHPCSLGSQFGGGHGRYGLTGIHVAPYLCVGECGIWYNSSRESTILAPALSLHLFISSSLSLYLCLIHV
jgi:hypothetical protein